VLSDMQQRELESLVQGINADLRVEAASFDAQQTLEVVLCRDFVCFRPLQISAGDVDVLAALAGKPKAQQALQMHLSALLKGMI
jgi:hypothetical protein